MNVGPIQGSLLESVLALCGDHTPWLLIDDKRAVQARRCCLYSTQHSLEAEMVLAESVDGDTTKKTEKRIRVLLSCTIILLYCCYRSSYRQHRRTRTCVGQSWLLLKEYSKQANRATNKHMARQTCLANFRAPILNVVATWWSPRNTTLDWPHIQKAHGILQLYD